MYHTIYHTKKTFKINCKIVLTYHALRDIIKTVKRDTGKIKKRNFGGFKNEEVHSKHGKQRRDG